MADLRLIAQTMISAGYGRECVKIYIKMRKSIVDEGLYRLGFESLSLTQIQKLDWTVVNLKIRSWLVGARVAVRTLFSGERILCDHVFDGSDSIRESCFAEISKDAAVRFLAFPELIAKSKKSPEKLFRVLDLYTSLSDLALDIESVFSFESTAIVRSQAESTLSNLAEAVRSTITEFESAIHKDASKIVVAGGGIHPLTRYAMNYLALLADYDLALSDIFADVVIKTPYPLPESFFDSSTVQLSVGSTSSSASSSKPSLSIQIAWLILVLLCKLDSKAEIFKEVALSYLFLANNLQFVIHKVRSSRLASILGEDWATKHEAEVRHYASSYKRLGWSRMAEAIPAAEEAAEGIRAFYLAFEEAVSAQSEWVIEDERMREEMRESVAEMIVPLYREFYDAHRRPLGERAVAAMVARYAPEVVQMRVRELFSAGGLEPAPGFGFGSGSGSRSLKSLWSFASHG